MRRLRGRSDRRSERLRESIFDILAHRHGSGRRRRARRRSLRRLGRAGDRGAVARRRVSRCSSTTALRRARCCAPMSRRLALGGVTRIWRADATRLGKAPAGPPFTLAFLDPPYDKGLAGPGARRAFARAAGSRPARSSSSRRRPRRRSPRRRVETRRRTGLRRNADRVLRRRLSTPRPATGGGREGALYVELMSTRAFLARRPHLFSSRPGYR